ncbi:protein transporter Sec31 [Streptomyces sp. NPDC059340]|uniref:protein transporter Sec31 n=1 Tax=Streptomyces sp. NPDC059340 TaxID=3346806 RepID=UPI0036999CA1
MKTRRTQTIERSRLVPHTVDGETELVLDKEYIEVPLPPRDWDQIVRAAVTVGACVLVTVSVVWSTSSIGKLLSRIVAEPPAYGAAVAFDTLWIMCTAVEWLLRSDPDRAGIARRGGRVALVIAMAAVFADGYLHDELVIGAVGAVVSALAKGGTSLAMIVHAKPLDARTQQWVAKRRAAVNGQLALIPIRRELQRGQHVIEAERRALSADSGSGIPEADPEVPEERPADPDPKVSEIHPGGPTTRDAVRTAWDSGIQDPEAVLRYVRKATGKDVPQDTVTRYLRALRVGA